MMRQLSSTIAAFACILAAAATHADEILDWNATIRAVVQQNASHANPGWSTRAMAITNSAMYDVLMGFERTHQPFKHTTLAPAEASQQAAVAQAAYQTLMFSYPGEQPLLDAAIAAKLNAIPDGPAKTAGIAYGNQTAQTYIDWRTGDNADAVVPYTPGTNPGEWRPDPLHPNQSAWGPAWGTLKPFIVNSSDQFPMDPPPALDSQEYADAFNQVKELGALNSATRTADQTDIAIFWAYDRQAMGPPPVLFDRNLQDIALAMGNTERENARLFAMASVAMADAATAAWDAKFEDNYWRPVTAIRAGSADGNDATEGDPDWKPLGAPGNDPNDWSDDFTPPFPAWPSGHATMGGALYEVLRDFYGTDDVNFVLNSAESMPSGNTTRSFTSFSQAESENGMSRVYMGVHWIFDAEDGIQLGNDIADWVGANAFQAVPEPAAAGLLTIALVAATLSRRRRAQ
ncbi:MAG: phosphatase PAP2 family protein [Planctomycetaceae bacterium]|nr:phosphatase PAP2 family protein [Planctomycetaceae bacterium]